MGCWGCGVLGMSDVADVGCWGCGMSGMWDVRDVECLGCGMLDVDLHNALQDINKNGMQFYLPL